MTLGEIKRLISNLVTFGTISQVKSSDGKALVRVKIMDRETDWLPVMSLSNSFKKHFIPTRVQEQCVVISPFGEASSGFVIRSIFNKGAKEPDGSNAHTEVVEYEDGTRFTYDTQAKKLHVSCVGDVVIDAASVTINAPTTITDVLETVDINTDGSITTSGDITAGGVVTDSDGDGGA